jgi:hypothetical protein
MVYTDGIALDIDARYPTYGRRYTLRFKRK